MGILSNSVGGLLTTIQEQYYIGCYINDITAIVGGPDSTGHYREDEQICNQLCHWVVDMMMEWSVNMLEADDLRSLINVVFKEPGEHVIHTDDQGYERHINVMSKHKQRTILKIVLTPKEWVA